MNLQRTIEVAITEKAALLIEPSERATRDMFATAAMPIVASDNANHIADVLAEKAYEIADAMMKARAK